MEFQKSEYFQKRAHKFYPSISRGSRLLKSTHSSLSRDFCYLAISAVSRFSAASRFSTASRSSSGAISPFSSFISHRTPARKFPERLFSPIQRPQESFLTTPPEISRFPFGTKVIKILDLSPYLPPTRPFAVSPTLSYSPKPVLPISKASLSPTTPPDRIHSSRSSIAFHVLSSSHPVLQQHSSVQFITSYNHQARFPDSSPCTVLLQTGNSQLATHEIARNLKRSTTMYPSKNNLHHLKESFRSISFFSSVMCHRHTPSSKTDLSSKIFS